MSSEEYINHQLNEIYLQLEEHPENPDLIHDLGVGYYLLGNYEKAISLLKEAVHREPKNKNFLYNLGNAYAEAEHYNQATEVYYRVIDIDGNHIPSLNNLADCYEKMGSDEKAFEIFEYITRMAPDNALSHFNLGNFLLRKNRHIEAVKCYRKAIEAEPSFTDAYHNIAWILNEAKALKEAEKYAQDGLITDPKNSDLIKLLGKIRN